MQFYMMLPDQPDVLIDAIRYTGDNLLAVARFLRLTEEEIGRIEELEQIWTVGGKPHAFGLLCDGEIIRLDVGKWVARRPDRASQAVFTDELFRKCCYPANEIGAGRN